MQVNVFFIFQAAYDETFFDTVGRDPALAKKKIRGAFVHVQAQFCHPSLGTKIHVNLQNANEPTLLEGFASKYIYFHKPIYSVLHEKTKSFIEADSSTNLMVYLLSGRGGGESYSGLCNDPRHQFNINGCGNLGFGGLLQCSGVGTNEYD